MDNLFIQCLNAIFCSICFKCGKEKNGLALVNVEGFCPNKFNHFICDNCLNINEMQKNKFYCNLCASEHSKVQNLGFNNIQANNSCSIF